MRVRVPQPGGHRVGDESRLELAWLRAADVSVSRDRTARDRERDRDDQQRGEDG
jgi:hypothetical protein